MCRAGFAIHTRSIKARDNQPESQKMSAVESVNNDVTGSGLGLAIVEEIAVNHGGCVVLDSPVEGPGLLVKVFFPRA